MENHREGRRAKRKGNRVLTWLGILFVLGVLVTSGFAYIYITHPSQIDVETGNSDPLQKIADDMRSVVDPKSVFLKTQFNILVLGLDENWTTQNLMYTKNTRSDTVLVVSLSLNDKTVKVLSIPRDSYVEIPEYGHDKINAAHAIGGMPLAKKTVEAFLGVPIDYTVLLKVEATKNIVDAIGGVDITIEKQMDYDDNWGHLHIHLQPGLQQLNGEQALGFSRFRHDERGDFSRMERQQQLLRSIVAKLRDPFTWRHLGELVRIVKQNATTDLATPQLIALANLYKYFDPSQLKAATLEGETQMVGGMSVVIQNEEIKAQKIKEYLYIPQTKEAAKNGIRVEVLNGTGTSMAAAGIAEKLKSRGYLVVNVTDANSFDYEETVIIDHRREPALSQDILQILGKGSIKIEPSSNGEESDITVIVGKDYQN